MASTLHAALLGFVQGLTEFLPVSSSAHLILARAFFGFDADTFGLAFDVACHVGTLLAVCAYFHRDLARMAAALTRPREFPRDPDVRLAGLLLVGTIPAVVVGLLFNRLIEDHLRTPLVCAVTLAVVAIGLFAAERSGTKTRAGDSLTVAEAFWIGCAQASALVPGVSRSGATLMVAMLFGLRRWEAARFVFLLSVPAILAAAVHEMPAVVRGGLAGDEAGMFVVGVASSALVGYLAVKYFIHYLTDHSLDVFAWYRLALAGATAAWLAAK